MATFSFQQFTEEEVISFVRALVRGGDFAIGLPSDEAIERAIDIIDEPHKWSREMTAWRASGSPEAYTYQPEGLTD
jgi:hypothetical protein